MSATLIVRCSDNAVFEHCGAPARENPPLFVRLQWVRRRFWFGGKFVRTRETWQTSDDSLYEVIDYKVVAAGAKELARRERRA